MSAADDLQERHDALVAGIAESLDIEAGLAEIIEGESKS